MSTPVRRTMAEYRVEWTMTVPAGTAVRAGWTMFWLGLWGALRRSTVTYAIGHNRPADRDARGRFATLLGAVGADMAGPVTPADPSPDAERSARRGQQGGGEDGEDHQGGLRWRRSGGVNSPTIDRPPRYFARPRIWLAPLICWLRGHRWLLSGFGPDGWGTWPFECSRCEARCRW